VSDNLAGSRLLTLARRAPRLPHPALAVALAVLLDVVPFALFIAIDAADMLPDALLPAAIIGWPRRSGRSGSSSGGRATPITTTHR